MNITIKVGEKEFIFKAEESISDRMKIETEASNLVGGRLNLADLTTALDKATTRVIQRNADKFGKEAYDAKRKRLKELSEAKQLDEEYQKLFTELNDNDEFYSFITLQTERDNIYAYARLKVLCIKKPEGYEFFEQPEADLKAILELLEKEKIFFRR